MQVSTAWNQTAGSVTNTGSGVDKIQFTGGGSTTYTGLTAAANFQYWTIQISSNTTTTLASNLTLNNNAGTILTIDGGSTFNAVTYLTSTNSGTNTISISGTFKTADLAGFSGSTSTSIVSTNTPTITLNAGSTVEYDAPSGTQTVTNKQTYSNLTIGDAITTPATTASTGAAVTVSGVLNMASGTLTTTTTNTVSITNTATTAVTGGSTTSFIIGPLNLNLACQSK